MFFHNIKNNIHLLMYTISDKGLVIRQIWFLSFILIGMFNKFFHFTFNVLFFLTIIGTSQVQIFERIHKNP